MFSYVLFDFFFLFKHSSGVSMKAWEDSVTIFFIVPVRVNLIVRVNCELVVHELICKCIFIGKNTLQNKLNWMTGDRYHKK